MGRAILRALIAHHTPTSRCVSPFSPQSDTSPYAVRTACCETNVVLLYADFLEETVRPGRVTVTTSTGVLSAPALSTLHHCVAANDSSQ